MHYKKGVGIINDRLNCANIEMVSVSKSQVMLTSVSSTNSESIQKEMPCLNLEECVGGLKIPSLKDK